MKERERNDTPFEPLPAIFRDVSCFFKHRLQNRSHIVSSGAEGNDCGLAGDAASEYGINVPMKHTTLRCYGPGRVLIPLLIMPFGQLDSQPTCRSESTPLHTAFDRKRVFVTLCLIFSVQTFLFYPHPTSNIYDPWP